MKHLNVPVLFFGVAVLAIVQTSGTAAAQGLNDCRGLPPPKAIVCLQENVETLHHKVNDLPVAKPASHSIKLCIIGPIDSSEHFVVVPVPPQWKPTDCALLTSQPPADRGPDRGGYGSVIGIEPPPGARPQFKLGCIHNGDRTVSLSSFSNVPSYNCGW